MSTLYWYWFCRHKPSQKVVLPSHKVTFLPVFTHLRTVEPIILNPPLHANLQTLPNWFPHTVLESFPLLGAERTWHLNTVNEQHSIKFISRIVLEIRLTGCSAWKSFTMSPWAPGNERSEHTTFIQSRKHFSNQKATSNQELRISRTDPPRWSTSLCFLKGFAFYKPYHFLNRSIPKYNKFNLTVKLTQTKPNIVSYYIGRKKCTNKINETEPIQTNPS